MGLVCVSCLLSICLLFWIQYVGYFMDAWCMLFIAFEICGSFILYIMGVQVTYNFLLFCPGPHGQHTTPYWTPMLKAKKFKGRSLSSRRWVRISMSRGPFLFMITTMTPNPSWISLSTIVLFWPTPRWLIKILSPKLYTLKPFTHRPCWNAGADLTYTRTRLFWQHMQIPETWKRQSNCWWGWRRME